MGYNATNVRMKELLKSICVVFLLFSTMHVAAQHQFDCPDCRGKGETVKYCPNPKCHNGAIFCEKCDYSGKVDQQCSDCNGSGTVSKHERKPCPQCKGTKYVMQDKQEKCTHCRNGKRPTTQNGQTVYVTCSYCKGSGYMTSKEKVTCSYCRGGGYLIEQVPHNVTCETCGGKGKITETCAQCDGKGSYACPTCKGYGNVREKCSRCNGNGVIYTD